MIGFIKAKIIIEKHATCKHIIISIVALFLFLLLMKSKDGDYLDIRFSYSSNEAYKVISDLGVVGRSSYLSYLSLDFGIIVFLSIILLLFIAILLKKLKMNDKWTLIYLLPFTRGICDIVENILIMIILINYPKRLNAIADTGGIVTGLKWILMIITMVFIAILAFMILFKTIRIKKHIG